MFDRYGQYYDPYGQRELDHFHQYYDRYGPVHFSEVALKLPYESGPLFVRDTPIQFWEEVDFARNERVYYARSGDLQVQLRMTEEVIRLSALTNEQMQQMVEDRLTREIDETSGRAEAERVYAAALREEMKR